MSDSELPPLKKARSDSTDNKSDTEAEDLISSATEPKEVAAAAAESSDQVEPTEVLIRGSPPRIDTRPRYGRPPVPSLNRPILSNSPFEFADRLHGMIIPNSHLSPDDPRITSVAVPIEQQIPDHLNPHPNLIFDTDSDEEDEEEDEEEEEEEEEEEVVVEPVHAAEEEEEREEESEPEPDEESDDENKENIGSNPSNTQTSFSGDSADED